jgi:hypothetical protein
MVQIERFTQQNNGIRPAARTPGEASPEKASRAGTAASPRGQTLASLLSSELGDRFYCWRGASGARYVCSVFQSGEEAIVADFSQGLIIGVARDGAARRPICVLSSGDFESARGRELRAAARAHGVSEWHIHFGADDAKLNDLAASLPH